MDLSKTGATENSEDASSDSEVAQFYRPGLCHFVVLTDLHHHPIIRFHGLSKHSAFIAQLVAVHEFVQSVLEDLQ